MRHVRCGWLSAGRGSGSVGEAGLARMARPPRGRDAGRSRTETRQNQSRRGPGEGPWAGLGLVRPRDSRKPVPVAEGRRRGAWRG